jgi:hypothetical protein
MAPAGTGSDFAKKPQESRSLDQSYIGPVGGRIGLADAGTFQNLGLCDKDAVIQEPAFAKPMARQALAPPKFHQPPFDALRLAQGRPLTSHE